MAYRKNELPPFSLIAYNNLGRDEKVVKRLNAEMEAFIRSKKGIDDLVKRIQKVTGQSYNQAMTVARTERTRVQGKARYDTIAEKNRNRPNGTNASKKGWRRRHDNLVRDSHATMGGQVQRADQYFISGAGNKLMYPGDPNAPASEVIRCRCYMVEVQEE